MSKQTPNKKGREGNPITLEPMTFEEAVKKMLATPPPKSEEKAKPQKTKRKA